MPEPWFQPREQRNGRVLCLSQGCRGEDPPSLAHRDSISPPAWEGETAAALGALLSEGQLTWAVSWGRANFSPPMGAAGGRFVGQTVWSASGPGCATAL